MSQVIGLPNNSYKPITNTAQWVRTRFCKLQKGCTRLAAASDTVYQLLAHGRWFSPGTSASSNTTSGRHDIAEILLKVALTTKNQIKSLLKNEIVLYTVSCYIEVSFKAGLTILLYFEMLINSIFFLNITAVILISYRQKKLVFNTYIAAARKAHARIWIYYQEWQGLYFLFYSKLRVWLFRLINYSTSHLIKI